MENYHFTPGYLYNILNVGLILFSFPRAAESSGQLDDWRVSSDQLQRNCDVCHPAAARSGHHHHNRGLQLWHRFIIFTILEERAN